MTSPTTLNHLALAAQKGDDDALVELLDRLADRMKYAVRKLMPAERMPWAVREDLEQVARLAVIEAIYSYDPDQGAFGPWAIFQARKAVADAVPSAVGGPDVPPRTMRRYIVAMKDADGDAGQARDSHYLNPSTFDAIHAVDTGLVPLDDAWDELEAIPEPEVTVDRTALAHQLLDALDERDRKLVTLVYFDEMPVAQAAEVLGMPRQRAYKRLDRAMTLMRAACPQEETP